MKASAGLLACLGTTIAAMSQTRIITGHVDLGVAYEAGALEPHVHDETADTEYAPENAVLVLGANTLSTAPGTGSFSFLGPAGSPVWILPAVQDPNRIFLGIGAEEVGDGVFQGDSVSLSLVAFDGPGQFAAYSVNGFGVASAFWSTTDGVSAADVVAVLAGSHTDYNFAFTAPGDYTVSLSASGTLADGMTRVESGVANFRFAVVPEPRTALLACAGAFAVLVLRKCLRR